MTMGCCERCGQPILPGESADYRYETELLGPSYDGSGVFYSHTYQHANPDGCIRALRVGLVEVERSRAMIAGLAHLREGDLVVVADLGAGFTASFRRWTSLGDGAVIEWAGTQGAVGRIREATPEERAAYWLAHGGEG